MPQNAEEKRTPPFIPIIAGGVSGVVTRFLCQPLDVIKIRFQLQVEPISNKFVESKYKSIPQAFSLIVREEGLLALWKGHVPAQMLSVTYGVIQFGAFEAILQKTKQYPQLANDTIKVEFACGFTAGCVATIVSFPFDVVRTRLVIQAKNKVYSSTIHGMKHILNVDGFQGLFRGLTPSLVQIGPLSGVQFASFHFYKRVFQNIAWLQNKTGVVGVTGTVVAGSLSGFTAKIITYPLDLTRKRLQLQGFQSARIGFGKNFICTSLRTCLYETVRREKLIGLYKGLWASLLKASVVNALMFTIYDETHRFLSNIYFQGS